LTFASAAAADDDDDEDGVVDWQLKTT